MSLSWRVLLVALPVLVAAYLGLEWLEFNRGRMPFGVAPFDPSIGFAFAVLLRGGLKFLPLLPLGEAGAAILRGEMAVSPLGMTALISAMTAGWGAAAVVLRRCLGLNMGGQRGLFLMIVVAGVASLLSSAAEAVLALGQGVVGRSDLALTLMRAWIGDMIGVLLFAPLLLVHDRLPGLPSRAETAEILALALVTGTMLWVLFWLPSAAEWQLYDLMVLPAIWAAARFGVHGAVVINIAVQIGMVAAFLTVVRDGDAVVAYQGRMLVLSVSTLFLGVAVSERRRAEDNLRRRQDQLDRCARLSIAGEMAAGLAHELNQPLSAALTYSRTAQRLLALPSADPARLRAAMDGAASQAERAGMIIRTLREFIGRGELDRRPCMVAELVRDSLALIHSECQRATIRLDAAIDRALPPVMADSVQVQQVLVNLLRNAIEAIVADGSSRRMIAITAHRVAADAVEIDVSDSGPGMSPDQVSRLFQPFSTTKPAGMGLGLAICRTIIESHGGRLWLAGNGPGGCSLRFTLPVASSRPPAPAGESA